MGLSYNVGGAWQFSVKLTHVCPQDRPIKARLYGLDGCTTIQHMPKRCRSMDCRCYHHYNYRWEQGQKFNILTEAPSLDDVVFINSKTAFTMKFVKYHGALQFRAGLSVRAIAWAQEEVLWDDNEHARWRLEFASAQLYVCVLQEAADMWASLRSKDRIAKFVAIDLEDPLGNGFLDAHGSWWASSHLSRSERRAIQEVVIDGNEKIATKCSTLAPAHAGRPRKDGKVKQRNNGWFMAAAWRRPASRANPCKRLAGKGVIKQLKRPPAWRVKSN